jgi:hypothetical protein
MKKDVGGSMAILTVEIVFLNISDEELSAAYDQIEEIEKGIAKLVRKLPIGDYLAQVEAY